MVTNVYKVRVMISKVVEDFEIELDGENRAEVESYVRRTYEKKGETSVSMYIDRVGHVGGGGQTVRY